MTPNPCRYCEKRHTACHDTCSDFQNWRMLHYHEKALYVKKRGELANRESSEKGTQFGARLEWFKKNGRAKK